MGRRFSSLSGFVLAGGESRRMGQPKPLLALAGETMLERQVRLLRPICRSVAVIGLSDGPPSMDVALITDVIRGRGPLGGIFTGLLYTRTEFNLFLGCDLPFVTARFLEFLVRRAPQCGATMAEMPAGGIQPLCAVYRRAALPIVEPISMLAGTRPKPWLAACAVPLFRGMRLPAPGFHRAFLLTSTRRKITRRRNES